MTPDPLPLPDGRLVLFDEPTDGYYRVQMSNGEVQAFPAKAAATPDNAVDDLLTNPPPLPAPTPPTTFTFTDFCARCDALIPGIVDRIYAAATTSGSVRRWLDIAVSRNAVHLDAPELAAALAAFAAAGLMTAEEAALLLAP